ncbi:MAG: hypothetical protein OQK54_03420, partial [Gammaproteobacteria bacterium]|nr:hypothetical protein [Gammaproteobacteria bacterium]
RWLRHAPEDELEIGVQALAPQARPVLVRNEQAGGRAAEYQYALLLSEIPAIKQPASLITPIMLFQPGNELSLQLPGDELRISLTRQLQDTGSFVQFLFSTASPPGEVRDHRGEAPTKPDPTSLNWDEL